MGNFAQSIASFFLCFAIGFVHVQVTFAQETVETVSEEPSFETAEEVPVVLDEAVTDEQITIEDERAVENAVDVEQGSVATDTLPTTVETQTTEGNLENTDEVIDEEVSELLVQATTTLELQNDLIAKTRASSSLNATLPFTLNSKLSFAINEVPEFVFSYTATEHIEESFVEELASTVVDSIQEIYSGSFVETVVEVVSDVIGSVVDFVLPEAAQGQEPEPETVLPTVSEDVLPTPEESTIIETIAEELPQTVVVEEENPEVPVPEVATTTLNEQVEGGEVVPQIDPITTVEQSLPPLASSTETFAVIDGAYSEVTLLHSEEGIFSIVPKTTVFMPGEHALELHVYQEGKHYIAYYVFTIEGTVLRTILLDTEHIATLVADIVGVQQLWLVTFASTTPISFEQIADQNQVPVNPSFTFEDNTLFWTTSGGEAVIGFDIINRSLFSQTLNTNSQILDVIETDEGMFEIDSNLDGIDVLFVQEPLAV